MAKQPKWETARKILLGLDKEDVERVRWGILNYLGAVMLNDDDPYHLACVLEEFEMPFNKSGLTGLSMAVYRAVAVEEPAPANPEGGGEDGIPF
jgi:hypothetical protein